MFRRKKGSDELCYHGEEGVAVVQLLDGTIAGQRCAPFDYTCKTVCSEKDMHKHEREEMHKMQQLKEGRDGW
eukprot:1014060-Ditylum_brightwellii.AAC.1